MNVVIALVIALMATQAVFLTLKIQSHKVTQQNSPAWMVILFCILWGLLIAIFLENLRMIAINLVR